MRLVIARPLSARTGVVGKDAAPTGAGDDGKVTRAPFPAYASEADGTSRPLAYEAGAARVAVEGAPQIVVGGAETAPEAPPKAATVGYLAEAAKVALGGGEATRHADDLRAVLGRPSHPAPGPTPRLIGGQVQRRPRSRLRVATHLSTPRAWRSHRSLYFIRGRRRRHPLKKMNHEPQSGSSTCT